MNKTNFAEKRLERFEKIKSFLEHILLQENSIFNLVDFSNFIGRRLETARQDLKFVCCREGFKLKALGKGCSEKENIFEVIK